MIQVIVTMWVLPRTPNEVHFARSALGRGSGGGLALEGSFAHQTAAAGRLRTSGRRVRSRSARGRPWRAHGSHAACGRGHGGVECARRLLVLDRKDGGCGVAHRNRSFSPRPRFFSKAGPYRILHGTGSQSTRTAAQKSAENTDCSYRLGRVRTSGPARARPQRPRAPVASP